MREILIEIKKRSDRVRKRRSKTKGIVRRRENLERVREMSEQREEFEGESKREKRVRKRKTDRE